MNLNIGDGLLFEKRETRYFVIWEVGDIYISPNIIAEIYLVIYIYIYIYIYILGHPQTDCFVVSQLFSLARHAGRFKLGSRPAQLYVRLGILPSGDIHQVTYVSPRIPTHYVSSFVCLYFALPDTRVLNLFEELFIT